jgi:ATP-dependent helicase/nuclease subunit A
MTPFAFYAWLLGGDGGRARILRRLGHEANDALDEFLELALAYERKAAASLQGFMAWLRTADTEVKRDMEISRDEVRVMTVHGAKDWKRLSCSWWTPQPRRQTRNGCD